MNSFHATEDQIALLKYRSSVRDSAPNPSTGEILKSRSFLLGFGASNLGFIKRFLAALLLFYFSPV